MSEPQLFRMFTDVPAGMLDDPEALTAWSLEQAVEVVTHAGGTMVEGTLTEESRTPMALVESVDEAGEIVLHLVDVGLIAERPEPSVYRIGYICKAVRDA